MEIKKKILVLGINCFPELTGIGKYSGEMVNWFAEQGYQTTMVTTPPYYPNWKVQKPYSGNWYRKEHYSEDLVVYRCPLYVPSNPSGLKRMIHEVAFFLSAFFVVFRLLFEDKQDIIFAIAPPFHLGILALFYRFFKGGKIVYHIQDLQIEAAKELQMLPKWVFGILFKLECFILTRVDFVSSISEGMLAKIRLKVKKQVLFFPNWVNTDGFYPLPNRNTLKTKWGYGIDDKVVLYSGSIGEKQGLDALITIADELKLISNLNFLICGTGPYKEELIKMVNNRQLANVKFLPLQSNDVFNEFLNMADVHLVLQKANASDLVMPSKLTTILAVGGLALVTASKGTTLYDVIKENKMGIVIEPENVDLLAKAVLDFTTNNHNVERANARSYAEQFLDKRNILPMMMANINN